MNNQIALLLIACGILLALMFVIPKSEGLGEFSDYTSAMDSHDDTLDAYTASSTYKRAAVSSLNCTKKPDTPGCKKAPDVGPVDRSLKTCQPQGGWGQGDYHRRSKLRSPCCQPPSYKLAKSISIDGRVKKYRTCDDKLDESDPIEKCVKECCANASDEAGNYDPSWYPMARCGCSLWCYNKNEPHFKKFGTAVRYISGDKAEAVLPDDVDYIGKTGSYSGLS